MAMPYYRKKRIQDMVINFFMLAFLALTLLPIVWMVYSSLKDSTDIAIGKVGMRRAGRDILLIKPVEENLLVLSGDGGINLYQEKPAACFLQDFGQRLSGGRSIHLACFR